MEYEHNGLLVTFEGGEGSGKTTLAHHIAEKLRKRMITRVISTREPTNTPIGTQIRKLIMDNPELGDQAEALLFYADRQGHNTLIKQWLTAGAIILCDRYVDSTFVYQHIVKQAINQTERRMLDKMTGTIKPDITFILDVPPDIGLARKAVQGEVQKFERMPIEFHEKVREAYTQLHYNNLDRCYLYSTEDINTSVLGETLVDRMITNILNAYKRKGEKNAMHCM